MKIKVHSSLKNIRAMVAHHIGLEQAINLAASTIVDIDNPSNVKVDGNFYGFSLTLEMYEIIEPNTP